MAYATAVCDQVGVPLEVVPLQREYWEHVVAYTVREARDGRTPNPDIMCNTRIKFGMFYDHVGKHFKHVATGHYARLRRDEDAENQARNSTVATGFTPGKRKEAHMGRGWLGRVQRESLASEKRTWEWGASAVTRRSSSFPKLTRVAIFYSVHSPRPKEGEVNRDPSATPFATGNVPSNKSYVLILLGNRCCSPLACTLFALWRLTPPFITLTRCQEEYI